MKKLFNFRPVLFAGIFSSLGVGFCFSVYFSAVFIAIVILLSVIVSCGLFLFSSKEKLKRNIIFTLIFISFFGIFAINAHFTLNNFISENYGEHYVTVSGKVKESDAEAGGKNVIIESVTLSGRNSDYNMRLSVYGNNALKIGDEISFRGYVYQNSLTYENRFAAENVTERIRYYASVDVNDVTVTGNTLSVFQTVKMFIGDCLKKGVTGDNYGIAYALLTGETALMNEDVLQSFRNAGVAHIFAVSGLHVGFLAAILSFVFKKLRVKNLISGIITVLVIFFYCGVSGFSSSCLRASIMFSVLFISRLFGKRYDGLSALGLAAIIVLVISPLQLFRTGFQLSFSVAFGILTLSLPLKNSFKKLGEKPASLLAVSLSSFLFGAPICMAAFNNVSVISVLVNMLLIPVISVVFALLFVGILLGAVTTLFSATLFLPDILLTGVTFLMREINFSVLLYGGLLITGFSAFYYLSLVVAAGIINAKRKIKTIIICAFVTVFAVGTVGCTVYDNSLYAVCVVGDDKICAEVVKGENEYFIIVSDVTSDNFSVSRISRAVKSLKAESVSLIIPVIKETPDVFNLTQKINGVVKIDKVYSAYSIDYYEEIAFDYAFHGVEFYPLSYATVIKSGDLSVTFNENCADVKLKGINGGAYLFSSFTPYYEVGVYTDFSDVELVVTFYNEEKTAEKNTDVTVLSYRGYKKFKNAGADGNYTYKFN